ncbi:DUF4129 domain-containing protein [Sphingomonas sp.]|uniref:DUF4129 domain-containing protein n=1 Tax=Sphingomonas sp. TaxID=28214 RepID=UPI003B3A9148
MRADPDIQFTLQRRPPPPKPPAAGKGHFAQWLEDFFAPINRFFRWIGSIFPDLPYAQIILWLVLIAAAAALLWMIVTRIREGGWRWPKWRRRKATGEEEAAHEEEWRPEAAPARAWLEEADALAARGLYAEAAHHLLLRSVEDIGQRRPGLVKPALTSRDLAQAPAVPSRARELFATIAAVVERSLFGGRPVEADEWSSCRAAYADFARQPSWTGAA